MTPQEIFPENWKDLIAAKIKRDKNEGEIDLSAATDEFFCFKCKKENVHTIKCRQDLLMNL